MSRGLADELLDIAGRQDMATNPFVRGALNGDYPREALRLYARQVFESASRLPRILSAILGRCDDPVVRRSLIGNLLEEEGATAYVAGSDVAFDEEKSHSALAARFLTATGGDSSGGAGESGAWIDHALHTGNWISPLAFITIGHEANVPATFSLLVRAFRDVYGFRDDELLFFTHHITADERHGAEGAAMVAAAADARGQRAQAIEGASRGARSWWTVYCRFDRQLRAYRPAG